MHTPTALVLLLSTIASGLQNINHSAAIQQGAAITWSLSNVNVGCSPGGCVFGFNISSSGQSPLPAFSTFCSGTEGGNATYQACADPTTKAMVQSIDKGHIEYRQVFVLKEYAQTANAAAVYAGNVTFPLEVGGREQKSAEITAFPHGNTVTK